MAKPHKRKYLCGCTVITRIDHGKRKFSIYPVCEDINCMVKKAVQTNVIFESQNRKQSSSNLVRFPQETIKYPKQGYRRNTRQVQSLQEREESLDNDFESRCK